jgi:hypothetical protein
MRSQPPGAIKLYLFQRVTLRSAQTCPKLQTRYVLFFRSAHSISIQRAALWINNNNSSVRCTGADCESVVVVGVLLLLTATTIIRLWSDCLKN